ncbi:MAG: hypothetical protein HOV81_30345 [Kofleriaceae bacterium]|nr:hypothetical protein [Kofleriaceae bacterium]
MILRYWRALLGGQFKLWQLLVLGLIWIAVGCVAISLLGDAGAATGALLIISGIGHFVVGAIAAKMHEHIDAKLEVLDERNARAVRKTERANAEIEDPPIPAAPKPVAKPAPEVRPAPPRIGNDPFRDPPGAKPLAIVQTATPPRAVPVAREAGGTENPEDKPKFLV